MSGDTVERPAMTRATLSRVADDADVSISTVSKVLNGRAGVSEATRRRVEELLRDHGYNRRNTPLTVAPLVEVVFSEIDSAWAIEIIAGVERTARDLDLSMLITVSGDRHKPSPDWIEGRCAAGRWASSWSSPTCRRITAISCARATSRSSSSTPRGPPRRTCRRSAPPTGPAGTARPGTSSTSVTATSRSSAARRT
ncbi:hypothetical protein GCM10025881_12480 [Pseudolysinimonas kribbensis]|uniref:HTH lacI-type domain-containing protein n=1 Tax=Pseudolysinimonas kribbensis TaxID=433641 RepID=A0ABQ6K284_9MICO|nr:hypothetical protein GCM10025881_12480 [Pseudolysinimonas kribbensis]